MPVFREANTGQVVTTEDDDRIDYFRRWARWQEVNDPVPAPEMEPEPEQETEPAEVPAPEPDEPHTGGAERPADDADRDEWVAYAIANGKTEDDLKGLRVSTIRKMFD